MAPFPASLSAIRPTLGTEGKGRKGAQQTNYRTVAGRTDDGLPIPRAPKVTEAEDGGTMNGRTAAATLLLEIGAILLGSPEATTRGRVFSSSLGRSIG